MPRVYRNPFDSTTFKSVSELEDYVEKNYKDKIPLSYKGDVYHYLYDLRNPKGKCQICGSPTKWDKDKKRYKILCEPTIINRIKNFFHGRLNSCQEVMRKEYLENIKRVYNTDNLMNSIEYQEMLLKNRRLAKVVSFKGKELTVIGSYEALFVEVCNKIPDIKVDDLICPGPTINYIPTGSYTVKQHIPDFYIKNINTIVSIKDEGFGNENHPNVIKKRKEDYNKFIGIVKDKRKFNAIELAGKKEIENFVNIYKEIKDHDKKSQYIIYPKKVNEK